MVVRFIYLIILFTCAFSCQTSHNEAEKLQISAPIDSTVNSETSFFELPVIPGGCVKHELKNFGLNASIIAPEKAYIYTSTINDNEGEREYIVIQTSESSNKRLEIISSSINFTEAIKKIESPANLYYNTKRMYSDVSSVFYVSYRKSSTENYNKTSYNFLLTDSIDGQLYHLRTDSEQDFTSPDFVYSKQDVLNLYAMARSLKPNKK